MSLQRILTLYRLTFVSPFRIVSHCVVGSLQVSEQVHHGQERDLPLV